MADDDDDDEIAMTEGQEPATNEKGEPLEVAAGGPIAATVHVKKGTRPISDAARKAFEASMAKIRARGESLDLDSGLDPVEHEELPAEAATPAPKDEATTAAAANEQAKLQAQAQATAPSPPPPVTQPPAPSLDPEVVRLRDDFQKRMAELDAREAKIAEAQRQSDIAKLRDVYFDKGAPAIAEIIKQWHPGLEGDELKNEISDLIQDLAHQFLDAPLDTSVKDRIATKRTRAGLKSWRQEQDKILEEQQKKLLATQEEENRARVKRILHQEVTKPDHASQFPYLASEANAGDLVFETIDQEFRTSGQQLTWTDAAKRVEEWLKSQALAFYDRRKHLLSPSPPPQQPQAPSDKQRTQGDTQVSRSHAPPKPPVTPKPPLEQPVSNQKWTAERHRESVKSKFRTAFRNQFTDDE